MLDFYTIRDDQAASARGLNLALVDGIEYEEFVAAQTAGIIEPHLDYYGDFRWSSEQVGYKLVRLAKLDTQKFKTIAAILKQAKAAESGLVARGD